MELVEAVLKLREQYPGWGKDKLVILLHREEFDCSASMAGRILHKLKERGVLKEPVKSTYWPGKGGGSVPMPLGSLRSMQPTSQEI